MKPLLAAAIALSACPLTPAMEQVLPWSIYTWTNAAGTTDPSNPANWLNGLSPTEGGSLLTHVILDPVTSGGILMGEPFTLGRLSMVDGNTNTVTVDTSRYTLTIGDVLLARTSTLYVGGSIALPATSTWQTGYSPWLSTGAVGDTTAWGECWAQINAAISGDFGIEKYGNGYLYLTSGANTFTGGVNVWEGILKLGTSDSAGSGPLSLRGGSLWTHGESAFTLPNAINIHAGFSVDTNQPLTFAALVTLYNSAAIQFSNGPNNPVTFTGPVNEATSGLSLTFDNWSGGTVWLSPVDAPNSYTGGTVVNSGAVIFGNPSAIPQEGAILVNSGGYAGAAFNTNVQTGFLDHFNKADSTGTIGFDTPSGAAAAPLIVNEAIDLTGFNPDIRLGTSTRATLAGTITPPAGASGYRFGGTGVLNINSSLTGERSVDVVGNPCYTPPQILLNAENTFLGGIYAEHAIVRVATPASLPPTIIPESGKLASGANGYIGYTFTQAAGLTPAQFLACFDKTATSGWIGLDAVPGTYTSSDTLDLSGFQPDTGLATILGFQFAGQIQLAENTSYHLLAGTDSIFQVYSDLGGAHDFIAGHDNGFGTWNGTVALWGNNSFTGDVWIRSGTLLANTASALPSGIAVKTTPTPVTLRLAGATYNNPIVVGGGLFVDDCPVSGTLNLQAKDGEVPTILTGQISGTGTIISNGPGVLILSGGGGFTGSFILGADNMVQVDSNDALAGAFVELENGASLNFTSPAPAITNLYGWENKVDSSQPYNSSVTLGGGSNLNITTYWPVGSTVTPGNTSGGSMPTYKGTISGDGGLIIDGRSQALEGNNTYTGGTLLRNSACLSVGCSETPVGTGPVSVTGGSTLDLNWMYGLANQVTLDHGTLAGNGLLVHGGDFTVGAGSTLSPGSKGSSGQLLFGSESAASNLILGAGSNIDWTLASDGIGGLTWDQIIVTGAIAMDTTGPVNFNLISGFDACAGQSAAQAALIPFDPNMPHVFLFATASAGTVNFDPALFNIDTTNFLIDTQGGRFSVFKQDIGDGYSTLSLMFTPVPEPETIALLALGLGVVGLLHFRRRKD